MVGRPKVGSYIKYDCADCFVGWWLGLLWIISVSVLPPGFWSGGKTYILIIHSSSLVMGRNMTTFVFRNVATNSLVAGFAVRITTVVERPKYQTTYCNWNCKQIKNQPQRLYTKLLQPFSEVWAFPIAIFLSVKRGLYCKAVLSLTAKTMHSYVLLGYCYWWWSIILMKSFIAYIFYKAWTEIQLMYASISIKSP